jgi:hypothetical protein
MHFILKLRKRFFSFFGTQQGLLVKKLSKISSLQPEWQEYNA